MTTSVSAADAASERVDLRRLPRAAIITVLTAIAVNVIVLPILMAILPLPADFRPLSVISIIWFTFLGTAAAAVVYWIIAKLSARPVRTFRVVAVIALVLSIIPNLAAMGNPAMIPFPGGTPIAFVALIIFHVIAGVICMVLLPRLTRAA